MEENFAKLEVELRGQLDRAQEKLRGTILKSQQDMVKQISQLLGLRDTNDPSTNDPSDNLNQRVENLPLPHIFVASGSEQPQGVVIQGDPHQTNTPIHAPPKIVLSQAKNIEDDVPNLDEMDKLNKVNVEFSKQLEETCRGLLWKELAKAFIDQYKPVTDMVPNILMLQDMVMDGECIETTIKNGKLTAEKTQKQLKKKDSEVNATSAYPALKNLTISQL
ncbi:hypothetical protein GQ457_01G014580 [Hibiscus cannabinus]